MIQLPYTYATRNSNEVAHDLHNTQINDQHKIITLDIKDLFVKLSIQNAIHITKFLLHKHNIQNKIIKETLELTGTVLHQNYFQYDNNYYQPNHGIAMGSPLSSTIAEIYLQYFEELTIKHWMETNELIYYKRYVDDIIIFDKSKITEDLITQHKNSLHKFLEFKQTI